MSRPDDGRGRAAPLPAGDEAANPTAPGAPASSPAAADDDAPVRRALIAELRAAGVDDATIAAAAGEQRLALLPVQRQLRGDPTLRTAELAERGGLDPELLERVLQAAGVPIPDHGDPAWQERDVALPALVAALSALGFADDALVELSRAIGESAARIGAALIIGIGSGLTREGDDELALARRLAEGTRPVDAHLADAIGLMVRAQAVEQLTAVALDAEQIADGSIAGARPVAVGFADVVGFTRMGERLGAKRSHDVAARLGALGTEVCRDGVRVVKTIGDAVMLAGARPAPVVASMLALQERVGAEEFPRIRAGVATGDAVPRAGDWFGPPVNRAARACAAARPETVLADDATRSLAGDDGLEWSTIGRIHLKGMGRVRLHRVRASAA